MKKRPRPPKKQDPRTERPRPDQPPKTPKGPPWYFGRHATIAALANPLRHCHQILVTEEFIKTHGRELEQAVAQSGRKRPTAQMKVRGDLENIAFGGPSHHVHQGIVAQIDNLAQPGLEDILQTSPQTDCLVVLDQASDPQNIGAILRSCAALGARALVMQDRHAPDLTPALAKVACGAVETIPVIRIPNLARALDQMKEAGFWSIGLEGSADQMLHETNLDGKTVLVMGAEGQGLRRLTREKCDFLAKIPIQTDMESLNLSNATAISLYEVRRQFLKPT